MKMKLTAWLRKNNDLFRMDNNKYIRRQSYNILPLIDNRPSTKALAQRCRKQSFEKEEVVEKVGRYLLEGNFIF